MLRTSSGHVLKMHFVQFLGMSRHNPQTYIDKRRWTATLYYVRRGLNEPQGLLDPIPWLWRSRGRSHIPSVKWPSTSVVVPDGSHVEEGLGRRSHRRFISA